jgi:hypothetical protein
MTPIGIGIPLEDPFAYVAVLIPKLVPKIRATRTHFQGSEPSTNP